MPLLYSDKPFWTGAVLTGNPGLVPNTEEYSPYMRTSHGLCDVQCYSSRFVFCMLCKQN